MDILVNEVKLAGHGVEYLTQDDFEHHPCPICGSFDGQQLIAEVRAGDKTSIESAFCPTCEHRYHRKFPGKEWLQSYYREKFFSREGIVDTRLPVFLRIYRMLRSSIAKLIRYGLNQDIPNKVYDFTLGIAKGDGCYYERHSDVRKVLEVGCGNGDTLAFFRDKGFEVYGTEVSPVRLAKCQQKGLPVFATGIDNFDEVAGFAPFDFVYSTHVLEHIIDVDSHIHMLADLLRPGGYAYIETPDLSGESLVYQTHTIYHVHTFSLSSMLRLLAKHGLQAIRVAVDGNIQVLAQKRAEGAVPLLSGRAYPDSSLPYLRCMAENAPGKFRLLWDHYQMNIHSGDSGKLLFQSGLKAFEVNPGPNRHELSCSVELAADSAIYPVRFIYQDKVPPIWYKT